MSDQAQSDIEIYVKNTSLEKVQQWLESLFDATTNIKSAGKVSLWKCQAGQTNVPVEVVLEAVGKNYTCIWFQSDKTPWESDLDCARAAFKFFNSEIRCSEGDWQEEDGVPEKQLWWRINEEGEKQVVWN